MRQAPGAQKPARDRNMCDQNTPSPSREDSSSSLRRLATLLRPHLWRVIFVLGMLFALTAVNLMPPAMMKLLVDDVLDADTLKLLPLVLAGFLFYALLRNLLYFQGKTSAVRIGEQVAFTLRNRLFERLQQMNLQFYRANQPGKLSSRVMDDSFVVQTFIQDDLPKILQSGLLFLGLVAVLYAMNWQLALVATVVLPFHLITVRLFRRPIKRSSKEAQEHLSSVHGNLIEQFLGAEVVKGFTAEERENRAFQQAIDSSRRSQIRSKTYHVWQKVIADLLVGTGAVALVGFGAVQVVYSDMSTGVFLAFYGYVWMLYPNVLELVSGFAKLTRSTASIDRVFEMLASDQTETRAAQPIRTPIRGHVKIDRVSFRYGDGPPVLRNISLEVQPGQVCAIVGPSGAGKSTLVNLVPRLIEPQMGNVMVDQVNVRDYDLRHLRRSVGISFQECFLFNSSIFENLRYARPDATMHQIVEAAKRTGAHDFITRLPRGYATVIGEDGLSLSRGEKQRITLTRAMLKNPRILILDEATASLDVASETRVIPAILEFMRGKTTLMITHNPELLVHADTVVRISQGRVVYQGSPEDMADDWTVEDQVDPAEADRAAGTSGIWPAVNGLLVGLTVALATLCGSAAYAQQAPQASDEPAPKPAADQSAPVAAKPPAEAIDARFIPMAGLNDLETVEVLEVLTTRLRGDLGYAPATRAIAEQMPQTPPQITNLITLARSSEQGLGIIQTGYRHFVSQPPHIWIAGLTLQQTGAAANDDVDKAGQWVAEIRKNLDQQLQQVSLTDLATRKISLSYVSTDRCTKMLQTFGYTIGQAGKPVDIKQLPVILDMPPTDNHKLVAGPDKDFPLTDADPINDLLVVYHPARPEQFSGVVDKVRTLIDVPARQIMIEAMILEISDSGLEKLGVEWELESPMGNLQTLTLGRLPSFETGEKATLDATLANVFGEFSVSLQALLRDGEAEVLSRPSVLTLNNRMANLSVEERIPVVTSISQGKNEQVFVKFDDKVAGIRLNVRPRVSADGEEISMQVVASVSARVPNADVVVKNSGGDEVARSPTIEAREVKTYTRIANNTPIIIGGLIARDNLIERDKVPLLGDLPWIGQLMFSSNRIETLRREVIIVITPYVLPENTLIGRNMPKDEDAFDSFGHKLFRDAYRIRAGDVFDLGFLINNRQLQTMKFYANQAIRKDFSLADQYPFNRFAGSRIPGERILVYRQMYEVIKRLGMSERVDANRLIFFKSDPNASAGFGVSFIWKELAKLSGVSADVKDPQQFFDALGDKAVAMTYTMQSDAGVDNILDQPVPMVRLVDCPSRERWDQLLWELNQRDDMGRQRFTILLHEPDDLVRVERAILLKRTVFLNANSKDLTLLNFTIGRQLLMPETKPGRVYLIDEDTARYFFYTEQYYPAIQQVLERDMEALKASLQMPHIRPLITEQPPQTEPSAPLIDLGPSSPLPAQP